MAFPPTPFSSANAVGLLTTTADELGVRDDLRPRGQVAGPDLPARPSAASGSTAWSGSRRTTGSSSSEFTPVDIELRYEVLDKGDADLSILFTTDAQLFTDPTTTRCSRTTRACCPRATCSSSPARRRSTRPGPTSRTTVEKVQESLTLEVMQELNARVNVDREKPADVAADYLQESGYVE